MSLRQRTAFGRLAWVAVASLLATWLVSMAWAGVPLSRRHKEWLEFDAAYIISDVEKKAFQNLNSDEERDKFIQDFWEVRDPTPGTPENEFKEEHYRRIQFADQSFGLGSGAEGWRTDRGRMYILLGPPQQRAQHKLYGQVLPLELWFYFNTTHPGLPSSFNILFYQRDDIGDFRMYSPYVEGPTKLVRGADTNAQAYQFLARFDLELARASLSLIPGEPLDLDQYTATLTSDAMLSRVRNLPNDKFELEKLRIRRQAREEVKSRFSFDLPLMEAVAYPLRDRSGEYFLHYALQIHDPATFSFGKYKEQYYTAAEITVQIFKDKKLVFERKNENVVYYSSDEFEQVKQMAFRYEDKVAIAPGHYDVTLTLLNRVDSSFYRAQKSVFVPGKQVTSLRLGDLIPFMESTQASPASTGPYEFFGAKLFPLTKKDIQAARDLRVFFQIFSSPETRRAQPGENLVVDYSVGRLDRSVEARTVSEQLDKSQIDAHGTLLTAKTLPTKGLPPGNYILSVKVTDPATRQVTGSSVAFRMVTAEATPRNNIFVSRNLDDDEFSGLNDYRRGLCYLANDRLEEAIVELEKSLAKNPSQEMARGRLVDIYFGKKAFDRVARLLEPLGISKDTEEQTVLELARSFDQLGQTQKAIEVAESAIALRAPTSNLYQALAGFYAKLGNQQKADEFDKKARSLNRAS